MLVNLINLSSAHNSGDKDNFELLKMSHLGYLDNFSPDSDNITKYLEQVVFSS